MAVGVQILGYISAFFISIAFLPQTYKLLKTRNTNGLSLTSYLIYQIGLTFFIIYASFMKNWPLLAGNVFGWVINIFLVSLIIYNLVQIKKANGSKKKKNGKETKEKNNKK